MFIYHSKKGGTQRGFTMLYSVLVSSLLLAIGISIYNLTLKELALSISGRESLYAFYSADNAAECIEYWDVQSTGGEENFPTYDILASSATSKIPHSGILSCGSLDILSTKDWTQLQGETSPPYVAKHARSGSGNDDFDSATTSVLVRTTAGGAPRCANVEIGKTLRGSDLTMHVVILSRGYNTEKCPTEVNSTTDIESQDRVERAIRITYSY